MTPQSSRLRSLAGVIVLTGTFVSALSGVTPAPVLAAGIETASARHLFDIAAAAGSSLVLPTDVAVSPDGRVYVVDGGNHRVAVFNRRGKYLFSIGGRGTAPGQFRGPVGVGLDPAGRVYVADRGNHRVQVFSPDGTFERSFAVAVDGTRVRPIDVAADSRKRALYVTGNDNHRVMVFTEEGRLLHHWGGEGTGESELRYPATVTTDPDGRVYVVDVLNTRVQIFDRRGDAVASAGRWGVLPGQLFRPKGVALDDTGRIYVSDSYMNVIQVFDDTTRFLYVLGRDGTPRRFSAPGGMAIDAQGRLYVAEMLANKVSVFSLYR